MTAKPHKISKRWIQRTREYFREFLDETDFPDPERPGTRGPKFLYPEWMIMLTKGSSPFLILYYYILQLFHFSC
jgi:hypothetical protein